MRIPILYQDDQLVLVNKPAGIAVHRSKMVAGDDVYLIDLLRAQLDGKLYLAHRLDRATSGVLLLARDAYIASALGQQFMSRDVQKRYLAIVRGWPEPATGSIDHPLCGEREHSASKAAVTHYRRLAISEAAIPMGRYPQQRYSLLELTPETGRWRQIRRHLHHISHHLIGDTSHGRGDHNRLFKQHFGLHGMWLHALSLSFVHPHSGQPMTITAPPDAQWQRAFSQLGWDKQFARQLFYQQLLVLRDAAC